LEAVIDKTHQRHLILGGSGFLGRHVAAALLRAGHSVKVASRNAADLGQPAGRTNALEHVALDLKTADWPRLIESADVVHHFAWSTIPATANSAPSNDLSTNVLSTLGLLEAARQQPVPPRILFASSGGTVYGRLQHVPVTETHPMLPITAYGVGKAAVELYLGYYRAMYGLDCRIARISNPFGAGQNVARGQGAVTVFLNLALRHQPIEIWGDGEVIRDYIHVADAAEGLVRLACMADTGEHWTFNIASGHGVSLNGIISEIEMRLGYKIQVARSPSRKFDVPVSILDISLAKEVLGWAPNIAFSDGVARTIAELRLSIDPG
jgi:UDP-glucose 4-epimerase